MGLFNKLFGTNKKTESAKQHPENSKLVLLLEKYGKNPTQENYKEAFDEIINGNSFLILPSINDENTVKDKWTTIKKGATLQLTSVFDQDGLIVLGAFTSPENLLEWSKKETQYKMLKSKDVIDFCQMEGIDRIVIDSLMSTMFVLERDRENIKTETIKEKTEVTIGTPTHPISGKLLKKFQNNFSKVSVIKEVYQYAMIRNNETILILGFVLDTYTENSKLASIHSVQNSMDGESLDLPLEIFMLDSEGWYSSVNKIQDSLMYKRF